MFCFFLLMYVFLSGFFICFFFFKQKTAYEMLRSLVGSEMCIRDSTQKSVSFDLQTSCELCGGRGGPVEQCGSCGGTGVVSEEIRRGWSVTRSQRVCSGCRGAGGRLKSRCESVSYTHLKLPTKRIE
eukprot:TRINITY_DN41159_c0_g1_i1.p2 TRINITY_DN41159_c0_g1~~TRINITY_DN41159_c0_g1_i1.p2  ORF type:complete len:127 (+),score=33.12 TRINITY_DN41159_c0_g1_i1:77-457(+)